MASAFPVVPSLAGILAASLLTPAGEGRSDRLLWHAEAAGGREVTTWGADVAVNPASVVKVGTTLWALDVLGASHRYLTEIGYRGTWDPETGQVDGSLVVRGGGDPDFQAENAFLVAVELNRLGVRSVSGGLVVAGTFWMGWEHGGGSDGGDQRSRSLEMGRRLRQSLDPARWDRTLRNTWPEFAERRGLAVGARPVVRVSGGVAAADQVEFTPLLRHLSNPLSVTLKRFNIFSNNDIDRIALGLGGAPELQAYLQRRLGDVGASVRLETASGLGSNRMPVKAAVHLLRLLRVEAGEAGLGLADLLPVPGCDPGPAPRMFPSLGSGALAGCCPLKTGTLVSTDGGVAVLSGTFQTVAGDEILFCVAAPGAGADLGRWRGEEERWLADLMASEGGAVARPCGQPLVLSDAAAAVEAIGGGRDAVPSGGG